MKKIRKTSIVSLLLAGTLLTSCGISQEDVINDVQAEPIKDELVSKFKKDMDTAIEEKNKEVKEETKEVKEETKEVKEETKEVKEEAKEVKEETKEVKEEAKEVKEETKPEAKPEPKPEAKPEPKPEPKKSNAEIAKEVLAGKWGSGAERKRRLANAGYDANTIQNEVNKSAPKPAPKPTPKPATKTASSNNQSTPAPSNTKQGAGTIRVHGQTFKLGKTFGNSADAQQYIDAAPNSNIAVEWGPLDVTNGYGAKVAGHAPGVFGSLQGKVGIGTTFSVVDFNGNHRNYTVRQVATQVGGPLNDAVKAMANKTNTNESIILQFCIIGVNHLYYAE